MSADTRQPGEGTPENASEWRREPVIREYSRPLIRLINSAAVQGESLDPEHVAQTADEFVESLVSGIADSLHFRADQIRDLSLAIGPDEISAKRPLIDSLEEASRALEIFLPPDKRDS